MQKKPLFTNMMRVNEEIKIVYFPLAGLLQEGLTLALGIETRTLSLLANGPQILKQVQLSDTELLVLKPIFETFPYYCPYEVLLTSITSSAITPAAVAKCRLRLQEAQNTGTWTQELRPVRRALSSLRGKLQDFNLDISTLRERGCNVTSLKIKDFPVHFLKEAQ